MRSPVCLRLFFVALVSNKIVNSIGVEWSRPRVTVTGEENYANFANSFQDYQKLHKLVYLSACNVLTPGFQPKFYTWNITAATYLRNGYVQNDPSVILQSRKCSEEFKAPAERDFDFTLTISDSKGSKSKVVKGDFFVRDLWVVAMGDSFASGCGNPDVRQVLFLKPKKYIDNACSRSAKGSFTYQIYDKIQNKFPDHGILFTYIACSSASTEKGVLGSFKGKKAQMSVLEEIQEKVSDTCDCPNCCKTIPDVVLMSIGGNDLDVEDIATSMLLGNAAKKEQSFAEIPSKLADLEENLDNISTHFDQIGIKPSSIFYIEYFDPLRNGLGRIDATCSNAGGATDADFQRVENEMQIPLAQLMSGAATKHGWTFIGGIRNLFRTHGICAKNSYIVSIAESMSWEGNPLGALHPNTDGHTIIANLVWKYVRPMLL